MRLSTARMLLGVLTIGFGAASSASAQAISDGDSDFSIPESGTTGASVRDGTAGGTSAIFRAGGDTSDQLFQQWWWYRVEGVNTREHGLSNRTSNLAAGNQLALDFAEPEGFNARVIYTLTDGPNSPASANVAAEVHITNTTAAPMRIAFYCYIDLDLEGSGSDLATLLGSGRIGVMDNSTGFQAQFLAEGAGPSQVLPFSQLRTLLANTDVNDLDGSGLPFGPADFSGAWEWLLFLPAGETRTVHAAFALNSRATTTPGDPCGIDFNSDGNIDADDLSDFITAFFSGC